jgi:hypothetical protein
MPTPKPKTNPKKKNSALAAAASRKLAGIGTGPQYSPDQIAHAMFHAEERGEAERVTLEDGSWAWRMRGPDGQTQILKPTPEILEAVSKFDDSHHH